MIKVVGVNRIVSYIYGGFCVLGSVLGFRIEELGEVGLVGIEFFFGVVVGGWGLVGCSGLSLRCFYG